MIGYIKLRNNNNVTYFSMTLSDDKITEIFCQIDTFYIHFHHALASHIIGNPPKRKPKLSTSEVITLMILFITADAEL